MARDVVKQRGRALVGPLQIVEDDGRRSHRHNLPQQAEDRVEQPGSISGFRHRAHFGKQQAQIGRQPLARAFAQDLTDNIDPYAIGSRRFGFIGARCKGAPPGRGEALANMGKNAALADTRLAGHQHHIRPVSPHRHDLIDQRPLGFAADKGGGGRTALALQGYPKRARAVSRRRWLTQWGAGFAGPLPVRPKDARRARLREPGLHARNDQAPPCFCPRGPAAGQPPRDLARTAGRPP